MSVTLTILSDMTEHVTMRRLSREPAAVLEQLAVIFVVKDRPETARIFLNALSRNPLHRRRAREMLRRLEEDPRLADDPRIQRIRSLAVDTDTIPTLETRADDFFLPLLFKNKQNKMQYKLKSKM